MNGAKPRLRALASALALALALFAVPALAQPTFVPCSPVTPVPGQMGPACTPGQNADVAGLTLAAATASATSQNFVNPTGKGALCVVNIGAISAGSLTVTLQGVDQVSGVAYTLLASAALAAPGTTVLTVYPGATASANVAANSPWPRVWNVKATVVTGPVTATVGCSLIE